jgi:hypothetical protein
MLSQTLSSICIGLVWGWLAGGLSGRARHPWRTGLSVLGASLAFSAAVFVYAYWTGIVFFLGAALLAGLLHAGWRQQLRARYGQAGQAHSRIS